MSESASNGYEPDFDPSPSMQMLSMRFGRLATF